MKSQRAVSFSGVCGDSGVLEETVLVDNIIALTTAYRKTDLIKQIITNFCIADSTINASFNDMRGHRIAASKIKPFLFNTIKVFR